MCGIFGTISKTKIKENNLKLLAKHCEQREKDSSGLMYYDDKKYKVFRADYDINKLLKKLGSLILTLL